MQPVSKASSSSPVPYGENSTTNRKRQIGTWLSLQQPGSHGCSYCTKKFKSLQAAGGHQNAHRTERIESEMRQLNMMREDEKRREIHEGKRIKVMPSIVVPPAAPVASPPSDIDGGIDLELRLGVGPPKKVVEIGGFRPTARIEGHGNGPDVRDHPMPLRAGGASAIAGGAAGGAGGGFGWNPAFANGVGGGFGWNPAFANGVGGEFAGAAGGGFGWNPAFANGVGGGGFAWNPAFANGVGGAGGGFGWNPAFVNGVGGVRGAGGLGGGFGWNPAFANGVGDVLGWNPAFANAVGGEFPGATDQWVMAWLLATKPSKKDLDLKLKL